MGQNEQMGKKRAKMDSWLLVGQNVEMTRIGPKWTNGPKTGLNGPLAFGGPKLEMIAPKRTKGQKRAKMNNWLLVGQNKQLG